MSTSSLTVAQPRAALFGRIADYAELTRPRIAVLELVVVVAAGFVATWGQPQPWPLLQAMLGTLLVAASASAAITHCLSVRSKLASSPRISKARARMRRRAQRSK